MRELIDTRVAEITAAIADLRALRRTLIHARGIADFPCPTTQICAIIEDPHRDPPSPDWHSWASGAGSMVGMVPR